VWVTLAGKAAWKRRSIDQVPTKCGKNIVAGAAAMIHRIGQGYGRGSPMAMRIIFSLMDANGDGKLSLEEFQAAHERIFKAMDADHDGTVTFEEMQAFIRGH
jgi:Ca2+-binding EF-hand superfamily protein